MKKWFKFPNGDQVEIKEVLAGENETAFNYAPISYYQAIARERPWDGVPHVTGLLNGARAELLKRLIDHAVDVENSVWAITGLTGHRNLENAPDSDFASKEQKLEAFGVQGTCDHIERAGGKIYLVDSKFYGSYAVMTKLGVYEAGRKQKYDANGNPEYYQKAGKWGKAGDPKTEPVYKYNIEKGDSFDLSMQLNIYKLMKEAQPEAVKIDGIKVFIIPRDGSTSSARQRGILRNLYFIELPLRPETEVMEFIAEHRDALIKAMNDFEDLTAQEDKSSAAIIKAMKESGKVIPPPCNDRECWSGRRCQDYCEVRHACEILGDVKYLNSQVDKLSLEDF